jgi:hypothetical protein
MPNDNIKKNSFEKIYIIGTLICCYKLLILLQGITFVAYGKVSCYWSFVGGLKVVVGVLLVQWRTIQNTSCL